VTGVQTWLFRSMIIRAIAEAVDGDDRGQVVLVFSRIRILTHAPLGETLVIPIAHDGCPTGLAGAMAGVVRL